MDGESGESTDEEA